MGKRWKRTLAVLLAALVFLPGVSAQNSASDVVLLLDTSASMSAWYRDIETYLSGPFLTENLRLGDSCHIISVSPAPRLEISRRMESRGDIETVIGRLLLLLPLERGADVPAAFGVADSYIANLPARPRKIILLTDGDTPAALIADKQKTYGSGFQALMAADLAGLNAKAASAAAAKPKAAAGASSGTTASSTTASTSAPAAASTATADTKPSTVTNAKSGVTYSAGEEAGGSGDGGAGGSSSAAETAPAGAAGAGTAKAADTAAGGSPASAESAGSDTTGMPSSATNTADATTAGGEAASSAADTTAPGSTGSSAAGSSSSGAGAGAGSSAAASTAASSAGIPMLPLIIGLAILALAIIILIIVFAVRRAGGSPQRTIAAAAQEGPSAHAATAAYAASTQQAKKGGADALNSFAASQKRRTTPYDNYRQPEQKHYEGPLMLNLFVQDQNTKIGRRNIHLAKSGYSFTIGGGKSDFLIFLVPFPPAIAEVRTDGERATFYPRKAQYFPDIGSQPVSDCIGKTIRVVSDKGYEVNLRMERYEDPLKSLNRLLRSIELPEPPTSAR